MNFGIKRPQDFSPIPNQILEETIIPQFERTVQKHAKRFAIKDENYCLTYRELNNAINHLAELILQSASSSKSPVAFLFEEEIFSIVSLFAIIKAGKPFVGLYPGNSEEQLKSYLSDSEAILLITSTTLEGRVQKITNGRYQIKVLYFDEMQTDSNVSAPKYNVKPNELFGIFYTSGSTGKPKGVMVGHLTRSQSAHYMTNEWFFSPSDCVSLVTSVCFLAAYPGLMGALLDGALLCIFNLKTKSAQQALDWIINEKLTVFRSTPSIFRSIFSLAPSELVFSKLRFITLCGEPITETEIQLFKSHTSKDCILLNNYGATESGLLFHYPMSHDSLKSQVFLPVGFAAPGKEIMVVDDNGEVIKDGQEGEVIVKSPYLSFGYWKQPELTAQKFQTDPADSNSRIYFTGDRGHWREDGVLEVAGRKDTQVKIRGYRIQLEAIDLALLSLNHIKDAATVVHQDSIRGKKLVSYFSASSTEKISISELRNEMSKQLPSYMIPSAFVQLDSLPRTPTGKLDRLNLPEPSHERPDLTTTYLPPQTEMEIQISNIWKKMLGIEKVGIHDNFFELGGDSLLALEMTLEVEKAISQPVPQAFFTNPNIYHLSTLLSSEQSQPQIPQKGFQVESYKDNNQTITYRKNKGNKIAKLKKIATRQYSLADFDSILDITIGKYISSKTYPKAIKWAIRWSQNSFVQNTLYKRRYEIFSKWMQELKECKIKPADIFHLSILNNLNFKIPRYSKKQMKGQRPQFSIQDYKDSKYLYWRSLGEILDAIQIGQASEYFPIHGIEYLSKAYQKGKGVILLTFHGVPTPGRFSPLEKLLNLEKIETISYHIPVQQSAYQNNSQEIPNTAAFTLNAEIALFGQHLLQQGKIINFLSDTSDLQGKTYKTFIAGREYQIKGGFAELAINTGAAIIPHFRYCLPDGKLMFNIFPALDHGSGSRQDQVENLINQYAIFIEQAWSTHPEALNWRKIKTHLKRLTG